MISATQYQHDTTHSAPYGIYMVRAVKREQGAGGSYLNISQGVTT